MKKIMIVVFSLTCLCFQCGGTNSGYARIIILDKDNNIVTGATVTFLDHSSHIVSSGTSDLKGIYHYEQSAPIEEILEVTVDSPDDQQHAAGIIRIKPDEETELTLILD